MKRAFALAVVPVLAVALTACGDDDSGSAPEHSMRPGSSAGAETRPGSHNGQDAMFAQMMVPHHRQAIEMADLAASRASSPEVRKLAAAIKKAQDPEIRLMTGWLTAWGVPLPSPGTSSGMGSMHHGGMDGMMTEKDMKDLAAAKGRAFDTSFLEMMIKHHQGAVAMARTEQASGRFAEAKRMAGGIVASQSAEIATMRSLLER